MLEFCAIDLEGLHQKKKRSKYAGDQAQSDEETESENRGNTNRHSVTIKLMLHCF